MGPSLLENNLAYSSTSLTGDGSNTVFSFSFPYLDKSHITAQVNGDLTPFSWLNDSAVTITPAPGPGTIVRIKRTTPKDEAPVDFSDGSVLKESDLDLLARFHLFCAQESQDGVDGSVALNASGVLDGKGRKTTNFADPTDATGLVTKGYFDAVYTPQLDAKVTEATTQATAAAQSADIAEAAETNAELAHAGADAALADFRNRYQGAQATPPTARVDGSPLQEGDLYFRSVAPKGIYVFASGWIAAGSAIEGTVNTPASPVIATAGQSSIVVPGGYDPGFITVFVNGTKWDSPDIDVTSGSAIVFPSPLAGGEEISWLAFGTFSVINLNSAMVANGGETVADSLNALQFANYAALRSYLGPRKLVQVTGYLASAAPSGIAGTFIRDDSDNTSADNGGTIIVAANGKRWKRQMAGGVYAEWFGADTSAGSDSTVAIQKAIDFAESLVTPAIGNMGDPVNGSDVILRGMFKVSEPLRVKKGNVNIVGVGGASIYADFVSSAGYNGAKPVFIIGTAEAWQTSGTIFTNTKYNSVRGLRIKTIAGRQPFIGVLFSGTRNAHISDVLCENGYCGVYLENSSELLADQVSVIGCTFGVIQDNRGNRIASSSVLNVACVDNDVSSNTFNMTTLYYPQHTGFMSINAGSTKISGMTVGNFSENPAAFPGLGLPPEHAGIHVLGANVKWTRGMLVDGVVFEPSETKRIDCILIESAASSNPVSGVTLNNCHVQTHASDYAGGKFTVLLSMKQGGSGSIRNVVLRDSGFTPQNVGYDTGTMCINEGNGEVAFDGAYPATAFATSSIGIFGTIRNVEYLERTALTGGFVPTGWASDGVTTGCSRQGGASGVPAHLRFTGDVGTIALYKDFFFREYTHEARQVFISFLYRGDCELVCKARVNGNTSSDSDIASVENVPRYGNAILGRVVTGSATEWKRAILCFNPFDVDYPFDRVLFAIGKAPSAYNSNFVEIKDIRVGYMVGAPAAYNPF